MKIRNNFIKIMGIICILMCTVGCSKETINIKHNIFTFEYGDSVSYDVKEYIDNTEEFCELVEISGLPLNEENDSYPSVGRYEVLLKHKNNEEKILIVVEDTVAPIFTNLKDQYTVDYGQSFDQKIKAEDLSEVTITVNDSKVNYKKAGEYKATVKATDVHGNETEKEFVIKVKEEKKEVVVNTNKGQSSSSKLSNNNSSSSSNKNESSSNNQNTLSNENKNPYGWPDEFVITVPDVDMENHEHDGPAVENMYFDTGDELDEWAIAYRKHKLFDLGEDIGCAWGVAECPCGKLYIHRFY